MENKILISVAEYGELRAAVLNGNVLYDLDIKHPGIEQKKGNIYKGRISRIEPSLEAAFIDYGADRHGFLPLKEVSREYFLHGFNGDFSNLNIKEVIREGQEILVQIEKEERGNKGAALTTFISLAGSYVVLMPNNPRAGGISRRIEGQERDELRDVMQNLIIPADMGVIARTAGIGKSTEELQWDINILLQLWETINVVTNNRQSPFLVYQESDIATRVIKDHLKENIDSIIVDDETVFNKVKSYLELIRPEYTNKLVLYNDKIPLFCKYQIEKQIESAYKRVVHLPSGGSIVIDHTEALVSIDINSAKSTGGSDIEETALNTNLEASDEIAKQLRLRDIGGLIVIDFIDMTSQKNQKEVVQRLREALKYDRARIQVGNITRFGLLEMSRQRLRPRIDEAMQVTCPRCEGQGTIRSIESLAYSILHLIEEEAVKDKVAEVQAQIPTELATYLLNEKRISINSLEHRHNVRVLILPNQYLQTPKYKIRSIKKTDLSLTKEESRNLISSYKLLEINDTNVPQKTVIIEDNNNTKPAVNSENIKPKSLPPQQKNKLSSFSLMKIIKNLFGLISFDNKNNNKNKKPIHSQLHNQKRPNPNRNYNSNNLNKKNKAKSVRLPNAIPNTNQNNQINKTQNPQKTPQTQSQPKQQKLTPNNQNNGQKKDNNENIVASKTLPEQTKQSVTKNITNNNNSVNNSKETRNNVINDNTVNPNTSHVIEKSKSTQPNTQNSANNQNNNKSNNGNKNQETAKESSKEPIKKDIKTQNNNKNLEKKDNVADKITQKEFVKKTHKTDETTTKTSKNPEDIHHVKTTNITKNMLPQTQNLEQTSSEQKTTNHKNTTIEKIIEKTKDKVVDNQLTEQHRRAIEIFYNKSNSISNQPRTSAQAHKHIKNSKTNTNIKAKSLDNNDTKETLTQETSTNEIASSKIAEKTPNENLNKNYNEDRNNT